MKYLLFNAVVLAALGYLYLADTGRLSPADPGPEVAAATPLPDPETAAPPAPDASVITAPPPTAASVPAPVSAPAEPAPSPEPDTAPVSDPVSADPPPLVTQTVETLPRRVVPSETAETPPLEPSAPDPPEFMAADERVRELDRMIETMELFYVERIAR